MTSVPSEVHKCAGPAVHLRSEVSFLRTCNIPNLISYTNRTALLKRFTDCVSTWFWIACALKQTFAKYKIFLQGHCWWLTSRTCVNTLINETSVKYEAITLYQLRYCCSSTRATQNMSATRSSPTIGLYKPIRGLPLSAVTVSLHYLPRYLRSVVTCGKMYTTVTGSLQRFVIMLLLRNEGQA